MYLQRFTLTRIRFKFKNTNKSKNKNPVNRWAPSALHRMNYSQCTGDGRCTVQKKVSIDWMRVRLNSSREKNLINKQSAGTEEFYLKVIIQNVTLLHVLCRLF